MKAIDPSIKLVAPAAPFPDLGSKGWVSYVAKNTNNLVDILSWHNYGRFNDADQLRLEKEKEMYYANILKVETSTDFLSPTSKRYGAAITEYNMAGQPLASGAAQLFHSAYNAIFIANAIIYALKAKAELCTFYLLAQSGPNLLGILDPTNNWTVYKPYYTFFLFGNHMGTNLINGSGGAANLAYIASISEDRGKLYAIVINSNTTHTQQITLQIKGAVSGNYTAYLLDQNHNATTGTPGSYMSSRLTYTLPALSVVAFDIGLT